MSGNIARDLSALLPSQPYQPVRPQPAAAAAPVLAEKTGTQPMEVAGTLKNAGLMKTRGGASLEHGNDFSGMPIANAEMRGGKVTSIAVGDVTGAVPIDISRGDVFRMRAQGNITIQLDSSNVAKGYDPTDWERGIVLRIKSMGAYTITLPVGIWAPKSTAPTLNKAGDYEIGCSINYSITMGNQWYFYPINQPS